MDVLKLYDIEFMSFQGYAGRAVVQAYSRDDAKALVKQALQEMKYTTEYKDMYDVEELEPGTEPGVLMLGVND